MVNLQVKVYVLVMLINVQAWGTLGKNCMIYLQKGKGAKEVGRLRQERWSDKEGANRERIKVVVEHVHFKKEPNTTTKQKSVKNLMRLTRRLPSECIELTLDLRPLLKYAGEAGMVANMAV